MSKHRTVGISMNPQLEERAKARATALGLKFSPYATLCIEAELNGMARIMRDDSLDLEQAIARAREFMERKTLSIDFELDIEQLLERLKLPYSRHPRIEGMISDFSIESSEGSWVIECRYNVRNNYALALGQAILLKAVPRVRGVILLIPYTEGLKPEVLEEFTRHDICILTPDTLEPFLAGLQSA
ncbi:MAG: hypothetical protein JW739_01925 [Opitutales bacterium]|nr:hypothetical protein [Opitutales bacterium]